MALKKLTVIDDHTGEKRELAGAALLANGSVAALIEASIYCLNELYISKEDGSLHISRMSIGGVMHGGDIDGYNEDTIEHLQIVGVMFGEIPIRDFLSRKA